jgi:peptide/nickel transport system substrate-binding protein
MMNANGLLTGDRILTDRFDSSGFSYIGINAATVNVGGSLSGDASKALRKALATLFAVYRYEACYDFYGDSASVIEYPVSDAFWASPRVNDFGYRKAYSHDASGELYDDSMTDEERYAAALDACKRYLLKAGYVFDETGTTVLSAPEGAPLRFEVLLCPDAGGTSPFDLVLDRVKTALHGMGLVLDIRTVKDESEMWVSLHMGNVQIWCTSWSGQDPDYYHHYHSTQRNGVGYNFFSIDDFSMDLLLDNMNSVEDRTSQAQVYRVLMELVEDWGIEVPYLQLQNAVIYNAERVDKDSLRNEDVTPYWSWLEQASYISVKPEKP